MTESNVHMCTLIIRWTPIAPALAFTVFGDTHMSTHLAHRPREQWGSDRAIQRGSWAQILALPPRAGVSGGLLNPPESHLQTGCH